MRINMMKFVLNALVLFALITVAVLMGLYMSGCGVIDFREKAIAAEISVWGIDAEIPSLMGSDTALCKVKIGYCTTKYSSAPKGGKSKVDKSYDDINIFTLSGNGNTALSTEVSYTDSAVLSASVTTDSPITN